MTLASNAPAAPSHPLASPERDVGIDALRGFAVITMVGANLVPYVLREPYPFWLRVFASVAAPTFVLLAGFMVGQASVLRPRPLAHYLKRSLALLVVAALIDHLLWGATPFANFDVLHLIALVLPLAYVAQRLPRSLAVGLAASVFAATPLLQRALGYGRDVTHPVLDRVQALLVDGWFPVFPWLGVGLVGAAVGRVRAEGSREAVTRGLARVALVCLASGVLLWCITRPQLPTRQGYAELFYPPTLAFFGAALGLDLWLVALSARAQAWRISRILAVYGKASLLLYVVHIASIVFVVARFVHGRGWATFVVVYAAHAVLLWWLAREVARRRSTAPVRRRRSFAGPRAPRGSSSSMYQA